MSPIVVSHPLSCCTTRNSAPQLMFISFHVLGIHECHPATVKRNQQETKKGVRRGKEPLLDLHNEMKIITSSDETFELWKELIIKYSQGELLDVDATFIYKMCWNRKRTPHRDGILSCKFFKWLGNCNEDHKKLIQHILGRSREKRIFEYPMVIVK